MSVLTLRSVNPLARSVACVCHEYFNLYAFERSRTGRSEMYFEGIGERMQAARHLVVMAVLLTQLHEELVGAYEVALHIVVHGEGMQLGKPVWWSKASSARNDQLHAAVTDADVTGVTAGYRRADKATRRRVGKQNGGKIHLSTSVLPDIHLVCILSSSKWSCEQGDLLVLRQLPFAEVGVSFGAAGYDWRFEGGGDSAFDVVCYPLPPVQHRPLTPFVPRKSTPESLFDTYTLLLNANTSPLEPLRPLRSRTSAIPATDSRQTWHLHSPSSQPASLAFSRSQASPRSLKRGIFRRHSQNGRMRMVASRSSG